MVPDGWRLDVLTNVVDGGIKNGYSPNASAEFTGYWVLGLGALGDDGFNVEEIKPVEPIKKVINCCLKDGDFLISRSNTPDKVGRSILFKGEIENCSYPDLMMRFRINESIVSASFIEVKLKSYFIRNYYKRCAAGSSRTMVKITKPIVEKTPLLLPPIKEQNKIAKILTTWDKAITTTEKLLANSQQQKKALMQQLLTGKKRFTEFDSKWEKLLLQNIATIVMGSSPSSGAYNESGEGLPLLQGNADIKDRLSAPRIYTSQITKECEVADVLLSVRAPVGSIARSKHHACIGRGIAAIRAKKCFYQNYIYFWLLFFEPRWVRLSQGSTFESVNSNDIKTLSINIPSEDEQKKIAEVLSISDNEVEVLKKKLDCLKEQKKALMQQLLTGKRRVKVDA